MNPDVRRELEQRLRRISLAKLEAELEEWPPDSEEQRLVESILAERRAAQLAAADTPTQQRFEKDYEQKERHHRARTRAARIAAVVSIIGALASWAGVLVQWHRSQPTAAPASPAPAASVTPAASPSNATLTPTPTPTPTPPSSSELLTTEIEKFLRYPVKHDDETSDEYRSREMGFVLREMDESKAKQREAEDAAIRAKRGITPTPTPSTPSPTPTPSTPVQPS